MKRNKTKWILPLLIASVTLTGCDFIAKLPMGDKILALFGIKTEQVDHFYEVYTDEAIAGEAINLDSASATVKEYYKNVDLEDTGAYLCEDLHALMWSTHKTEILYSQFQTYCQNTSDHDSIEKVPNSSLNEVFYSGVKVSGYPGTVNREHVWPAANSAGLWDHDKLDNSKVPYKGGGSDLYHVRMANSSTNTLRGNSHFIDFDDFPSLSSYMTLNYENNTAAKPLKVYGAEKSGNKYQFASRTEVDDSFKGDVARILAYLWLHYSKWTTTPTAKSSECANLSLMSVLGYPTIEKCQRVLCMWNKIDPPSGVELLRNETVQKIQGNRNPFVDFPGLMNACFDL